MRWPEILRQRARSLFRGGVVDRELARELRFHLDEQIAENIGAGMTPKEARLAALRTMGGLAQIEEQCRDARGVRPVEDAIADLRYALRSLRRDYRFTLVALITLALGVGMNTAVFSAVSAVMLRVLPYPDAGRLISLWEEVGRSSPDNVTTSGSPLGGGGSATAERMTVAPANLVDYQRRSTAFESLAGFAISPANLVGSGSPERVWGERVTADFFRVLGVGPVLGRDFLAEDDRPGAAPVAILTNDSWQRRFAGDQHALGRTITLDDRSFQVVGILPHGFESPSQFGLAERIEFFVPAAAPPELLANHGDHEIRVIGRLKQGVSLIQAQAELDSISAALARQYPDSNRGVRAVIAGLRDDIIRDVRTPLLILLGAVGLIVLITCLNVANLMLVRANSRRHETSVRVALGASRGRIVRFFLVEAMVLSASGSAAGLLLGDVLMRLFVLAAPPGVPRLDAASLDWRVFLVSAGLALACGTVFGVLPAWQVSRVRPAETLRGTARIPGSRVAGQWRAALTMAEVSISLVLLIGAGLLLKSFVTVLGVDLGFQPTNVLAANINLPEMRYATPPERLQFFERLEERVVALPGVQSVAFANRLPMRGGWGSGVFLDVAEDQLHESDFQAVSPGYFTTLGIRLRRGRLLERGDRADRPGVAVVNETFSRRFLPGRDPIGRRLRRGPGMPWITIVGVVNDIRRSGKTGDITPQVYLAAAQTALYPVRLADVAVKTSGDPRQLVPALRAAVWAIDKDQPLTNVRTLDEVISTSLAERRFHLLLLVLFAGVAVALAVVGVFGVIAYGVAQRTAEFGIRLALGATSLTILALVLRQALMLIGIGTVAGLAGAFVLTRYVQSLLFDVQPHDAATYALTALLLVVVSTIASAIPAARGARVDPLVALRYE